MLAPIDKGVSAQFEQYVNRSSYRPLTVVEMRNQILGGMKILVQLCGMRTESLIRPIEMFVHRIHDLETRITALEQENAEYRRALSNVSAVLESYVEDDPEQPVAKMKITKLRDWVTSARESMKWVMQRSENALDPAHSEPITRGPCD